MIYCSKCRFFSWPYYGFPSKENQICSTPNNLITVINNVKAVLEPKRKPYEININNDCIWFKKRNLLQRILHINGIHSIGTDC